MEKQKIKEIIEEICEITIDDDLIPLKDFGVDSLSTLDITLEIKKFLNIPFSNDFIISQDWTLNELYEHVQNLV